MRNRVLLIVLLSLAALLRVFSFNAWSEDEVTLKTGAILKGKVVKDDGSGVAVELAGGKGTVTLKQEEVASISLEEPELFALATASYKKGDYEKALRLYQEVTRRYTNYDWGEKAQFWVGESNLNLRRWADALDAYRELLKFRPQTDFAYRAKLGMAHALYQQKEYEKAIEVYQALMSHQGGVLSPPIAARALYGLGNCYFKQGEFEEALVSYLKVVVLYYDFEDWVKKSIFSSGLCYERLGDLKRAKATYQELMEKYPKSEYAKMAEERLKGIPLTLPSPPGGEVSRGDSPWRD